MLSWECYRPFHDHNWWQCLFKTGDHVYSHLVIMFILIWSSCLLHLMNMFIFIWWSCLFLIDNQVIRFIPILYFYDKLKLFNINALELILNHYLELGIMIKRCQHFITCPIYEKTCLWCGMIIVYSKTIIKYIYMYKLYVYCSYVKSEKL